MAYLVLVINAPHDSITQLNSEIQEATKPNEAINNCINFLGAVAGGTKNTSIQITTRDTDPSVSTSGAGSTQDTYNKL